MTHLKKDWNFLQQRFEGTQSFACFDGLRAFAVIWVVLYHCTSFFPTPETPIGTALYEFLKAGDIGVDLFFVISGFLITSLMLRERPAPVLVRLKKFYMRRALRIFPLYYAAILVYWFASAAFSADLHEVYREYLLPLLFYYSDIQLSLNPKPFPPFGHSWSLAVEEKYYLLWPIIVMCLTRKRAFQICILLIIAIIAWRWWLVENGASVPGRLYYGFDTRSDGILIGAALAFMLTKDLAWKFFAKGIRHSSIAIGFVLLIIVGLATKNEDQLRYVVVPAVAAYLLCACLVRPDAMGAKLLGWKPLEYIGKISYGIYIFHPLAISAAKKLLLPILGGVSGWRGAVFLAISCALTILIASLSFHLFEKPFLTLKSRFQSDYAKK